MATLTDDEWYATYQARTEYNEANALRLGDRDLVSCLDANPCAEFIAADINRYEGGPIWDDYEQDWAPIDSMGDGSFVWIVWLDDGRAFLIEAWHDYTGWDCQSGATYEQLP